MFATYATQCQVCGRVLCCPDCRKEHVVKNHGNQVRSTARPVLIPSSGVGKAAGSRKRDKPGSSNDFGLKWDPVQIQRKILVPVYRRRERLAKAPSLPLVPEENFSVSSPEIKSGWLGSSTPVDEKNPPTDSPMIQQLTPDLLNSAFTPLSGPGSASFHTAVGFTMNSSGLKRRVTFSYSEDTQYLTPPLGLKNPSSSSPATAFGNDPDLPAWSTGTKMLRAALLARRTHRHRTLQRSNSTPFPTRR